MEIDRFKKQISFILESDKEKDVFRQTGLSFGGRKENDAEHAWHMALMTFVLSEYANEKIDVLKTVMMVIIHDMVEIYAGDTYAYDEEGKKTAHEREMKAADRIFGILPKDQEEKLKSLWLEFEEYETAESRFAHVMDNLQPLILNDSNNGGDWKENGVKKSQVYKRNEKTPSGSCEIAEWMKNLIDEYARKGILVEDI